MEALFNYKYGNYNGAYIQKFVDTLIIDTEYDEIDNISGIELYNFYKAINNSIYDSYTESVYPAKKVKCIDLKFKKDVENGNKLIALTIIGNQELNGNNKNGEPTTQNNEGWTGETPFNAYQGDTWRITTSGFYNLGDEVYNNTDVAMALKSELVIDKNPPTSKYWIGIITLDWDDINYNTVDFNYNDIYEYNPDIADPTELMSNDYPHDGFPTPNYVTFFHHYYVYYNFTTETFEDADGNSVNFYADYKQMNKLYNFCKYFMEYFEPQVIYGREIIDYDYGSWELRDYDPNDGGAYYAIMVGSMKLVYGLERSDDGRIPALPFKI